MSITFWLVRHGLKESKIGDVSLTGEGIFQARSTAYALSKRKIKAVVSSPLRRTQETAAFLAHTGGLEVVEDTRLRERANWGDLSEQTFEEFVAVWDRCTWEPDYTPPSGGDSVRIAAMRLDSALRDWADRCEQGSEIVFVTHGGLITDFLVCTFEEEKLNAVCPDFVALQNGLIPECSITELIVEGDGSFRLGLFADVCHLAPRSNNK
ncbi:histidine phosphatase family protein [Saccharibacillus kuerlensis]|nr:histidine phosphatase family protein [Saccharibacillus kuerlensis]